MTHKVSRIVLEAGDDGAFRAKVEGPGDTEGHLYTYGGGHIALEAAGADADGTPTYRVTIDGQDVEGHTWLWGGHASDTGGADPDGAPGEERVMRGGVIDDTGTEPDSGLKAP